MSGETASSAREEQCSGYSKLAEVFVCIELATIYGNSPCNAPSYDPSLSVVPILVSQVARVMHQLATLGGEKQMQPEQQGVLPRSLVKVMQ
jgi:hypothetical protein